MKANTISPAEVARTLGVRLDYVYRLLWDGTLDGVKNDGIWKIKRESVRAYMKRRDGRKVSLKQETALAPAIA